MNVPRELGGLGSSVIEQVIAQEEAGRATNDLWGYVGGPYNALLAGNAGAAAASTSSPRCAARWRWRPPTR